MINKNPNNKISLIKVNKKDNFNTANIFIKKKKFKQKNIINQSNDYSSDIYLRHNTDYMPFHKIKPIRTKSDISNEQIDIMQFQSSCNILNHKINQLRNFSKEIESYSSDNIKKNINTSNTSNTSDTFKNVNYKDVFRINNVNYLSYINNQNIINKRNKFTKLNLNYTTKKYFENQQLSRNSFNNIYNINNINKANINNKKKYSYGYFNNHINNINKINEINHIGINNNITRKRKENNLSHQINYDINIFNNYDRFGENERKLTSIPLNINDEKDKINLNYNNKLKNHQRPIYNKLFNNNNNIYHKRVNSYGINTFNDINYINQIINTSNNNRNNINSENRKIIKINQNNKNENKIGYFDNFFLKNKSLYFIENSCNYNIVNQNSIEKTPITNQENFQIQEISKLTYFTTESNKNNNTNNNEIKIIGNKNTDNGNDNDKQNNCNKKILIPININYFSLNTDGNDNKINNSDKNEKKITENNLRKNYILNSNKKEDKIKLNKAIKKLKIQKSILNNEIKINKNNNEDSKDSKDSLRETDDIIIDSDKGSINSNNNDNNKNNTEGKIISSDSENGVENEHEKGEESIQNNNNFTEPRQDSLKTNKNINDNNDKEDDLSKSEEEIFNLLLEKVKQNKELIEKNKKGKTSKKKVYFDKNENNYILYDLNKPVTKIKIYDNKGKNIKFIPIKLNDYIDKLKYSNVSQYKKLKPNLINTPKINYKKLIENSNKNYNKSEKKVNKIKKIKISPNTNSNNIRNSLKLKKHINSLCDNIIKTIDPLSAREIQFNINKDKINFNNTNNSSSNFKKRKNIKNSYDINKKKNDKNNEKNNIINLKRKKAKEKILNAIEDIKRYFKDID